jgi:hypothetical protein
MTRHLGATLAVLVGLAVITPPARAMFKNTTQPVPVKRLLENCEARLKGHPEDAQAHYVLARVHAMLYAKEADKLALIPPKGDADKATHYGFPPWSSVLVRRSRQPLTDAAKAHLLSSIEHYGRAALLNAKDAHSRLGGGWMIENAAAFSNLLTAPPAGPEEKITAEEKARLTKLVARLGADDFQTREKAESELRAVLPRVMPMLVAARASQDVEIKKRAEALIAHAWLDAALVAYRGAFDLCLEKDMARKFFGPGADSAISFEAGQAIVRILETRTRTTKEKKELAAMRVKVAGLNAKGRCITPIVFPLRGQTRLSDLIDERKTATFDLDGDDRPGRWPWLRPGTGILVWDSEGTGKITSGRQLFGSVTWWIAWRHGYEPLAALDDDRDGRLSGDELAGIAVWADRNGNAISDPGEVVGARASGIESIAVSGVTTRDGVPAIEHGITMRDGTVLPTWDWIARSR